MPTTAGGQSSLHRPMDADRLVQAGQGEGTRHRRGDRREPQFATARRQSLIDADKASDSRRITEVEGGAVDDDQRPLPVGLVQETVGGLVQLDDAVEVEFPPAPRVRTRARSTGPQSRTLFTASSSAFLALIVKISCRITETRLLGRRRDLAIRAGGTVARASLHRRIHPIARLRETLHHLRRFFTCHLRVTSRRRTLAADDATAGR